MATINNTIRLNDNMKPVLQGIIYSLNTTLNALKGVDANSNKAFEGMIVDVQSALTATKQLQNAVTQMNTSLVNTAQRTAKNSFSFAELASKLYLVRNALFYLTQASTFVDSITNLDNRLNLILKQGQSLVALNDKIYYSANRARSSYVDMANNVGKLGVLAGEAFKNTDEIIRFSELMEKVFKLSGASATEQRAASYQLAQAMASGRLQGDEFRSIIENAPMLANYIVQYTGVSKSKLRELSRDGVITSDIIKNSMFAGAAEIEKRFASMQLTIGQRFQVMSNVAIKGIQPLIRQLTIMLNSPQFNTVFNTVLTGIINVTTVALNMFNILVSAGSYLIDNWTKIAPIIDITIGALKAYIFYLGVVQVLSIKTAITSAIAWATANAPLVILIALVGMVYGLWDKLNGLGKVLLVMLVGVAGALGVVTYAQIGLNAAMTANPIGLIVTAIGLLILGLVKLGFYLIDLYNTNQEFAFGFIEAWEYTKATFLTILSPILAGIEYATNMYTAFKALLEGRKVEESELIKFKDPWVEAEKNIKAKKLAWKPLEMPKKDESALEKAIQVQVDKANKALVVGKNKLNKTGKESIEDIYEYNKNMAIKNITNMGNNVRINIEKIEKTADADKVIDTIASKMLSGLYNSF